MKNHHPSTSPAKYSQSTQLSPISNTPPSLFEDGLYAEWSQMTSEERKAIWDEVWEPFPDELTSDDLLGNSN